MGAARKRDRSRKHDLVIWGATGFTGKLVAEYLAQNPSQERPLRWALGGRNRTKLERVRRELSQIDSSLAELPLVVGDSSDASALGALARDTEVVCTTVGPYAQYGNELVAACVEAGTDYCDLTGEVQWIRRIIDRHHSAAVDSGARIVHCCGFDSIPSDLGVLMLQDAARERFRQPCDDVRFFVGRSKGGLSGGTAASLLGVLDEARRDSSVRKMLLDAYSLNPEGERDGPDGPDQKGLRYDSAINAWTAPFVMGAINTRIVRRSNALLGYPYGKSFRYAESMRLPPGRKGKLLGRGIVVGFGAGMVLGSIPPTRRLLEKALPKPGTGPSRERREAGFFEIELVGRGSTEDGKAIRVEGEVVGTRDPGYGETAKMLAESARCLVEDGSELETPGGILTPASAMGMRLVERLRGAGMTFRAR